MGRITKRILAMFLVVIMSVFIVIGIMQDVKANADSSDRISCFIHLASGKNITTEDLEGLSEEELRFLGIYLSNFYVPFGTSVGSDSKDKDLDKEVKKQMVDCLKSQLSFDEKVATVLVEKIYSYIKGSHKELKTYLGTSNKSDHCSTDSSKYHDISKAVPANYYNFYRCMVGRADDVLKGYVHSEDNKNDKGTNNTDDWIQKNCSDLQKYLLGGKDENKSKYLYFGYEENGKVHVVADCILNVDDIFNKGNVDRSYTNEYTASQIAFLRCLDLVDISKGYGFSLSDFTIDDVGGDKSKIASYFLKKFMPNSKSNKDFNKNSADIETMYNVSMYNSKMAVDCFGDILRLGGVHQTIVIPGCMNPYTWQGVSSEGKTNNPGRFYPLMNLRDISRIQGSKDDYTEVKDSKRVYFKPNFEDLNNAINTKIFGGNAQNWDDLRNAKENRRSLSSYLTLYGSAPLRWVEGSSESENYTSNTGKKGGEIGIHAFMLGSMAYANGYKGYLTDDMQKIKKTSGTEAIGNGTYDRVHFVDRIGGEPGRHTTNGYGFPFMEKNYSNKFGNQGWCYKGYRHEWCYEGYPVTAIDWKKADQKLYLETDEAYAVLPRSSSKHNVVNNCSNDTTSYVGAGQGDGKCQAFTQLVLIDNLGVFNGDKEFSTFNSSSLVSGDAKNVDIQKSNDNFTNALKEMEKGSMQAVKGVSKQAMCSLYITYAYAAFGDETLQKDIGYKINVDGLPTMKNSPIELDQDIIDEMTKDQQDTSIKDWVYYLLHPTQGFSYVRVLITNKLNHLLLGWHSDMVGTSGTGVMTGSTKYKSNMGYVTMPDLSEIQWTDSLIDFYNACIPYLIILLIVVMLFAFITGALSLQHAIVGVVMFSVFTMIPVNLINGVVEQSNLISQNAYGNKFIYWALVQHQSYEGEIAKAADSDSYSNYLKTLYGANEAIYNNQGNDSIQVKWQAPKKLASLVIDSKSDSNIDTNAALKKMLSNSLQNAFSGESFLDDEDAVYLYRNYIDLANFSLYIYMNKANNVGDTGIDNAYHDKKLKLVTTKNWTAFSKEEGKPIDKEALYKEYSAYIKSGYTNGPISKITGEESSDFADQKHITAPLTSEYINTNALTTSISDLGSIKNLEQMKYSGIKINQDLFNFGLPQFNSSKFTDRWGVSNLASTGGFSDDSGRISALSTYLSTTKIDVSKYSPVPVDTYNMSGLAAYALYSENPYYYFSWNLYDQGLECEPTSSEGYKDLILGKGSNGYFNNTKGNGELKDFMDMRGLFTYIIPYMKQLNDIVREWDDKYGIFIYDGVPTEEGQWDKVKDDPELLSKYWHNLNVARLYDIYCPWVDVMYDCSYAKPQKISYLGKSVVIEDPINPASYPSDRPMIFSKSEMIDYGLSEGDLTSVERLILKTNEGMRDRMFELLNYYNFKDVVINSAAAIECAFEFNTNFSENGIFTDNHNIYPQSFDLSNFSYDAFLRFILSNSTGEDMLTSDDSSSGNIISTTGEDSGDFYERLVNRSSTLTVLIMIILDVISIYVIPGMRVIFLIAIFIASFVIILTSAMRIEENMKFVRKAISQFVLPLVKFFLVTIGFSLVISLFMGTGSNAVTQTKTLSISFGDPALTMIVIMALDIVMIVLYWKILSKVIKDIVHNAKLVGNFTTGVLGGIAVGVVGAMGTVASKAGSVVSGGKAEGSSKNSRSKGSKGIESDRAVSRGSGDNYASSEEINTRGRDAKKNRFDSSLPENDNSNRDYEAKKRSIDDKASDNSDITNDTDRTSNRREKGFKVGKGKDDKKSKDIDKKASEGHSLFGKGKSSHKSEKKDSPKDTLNV